MSASSSLALNLGTSSSSSQAPVASPQPSGTSLSQSSSGSPDLGLITQTGPIWEPTVAPGPITSGGMIIPIIPIIPLIPPPAGFVPPPPGTPEPTEQCPADYQETECGECGGEYGWCQHPPNQGCPVKVKRKSVLLVRQKIANVSPAVHQDAMILIAKGDRTISVPRDNTQVAIALEPGR
ncbi:hypothetical protein IMSHALPRED_007194 [Imshaugia aleurites]|uniref:Uncharacterized protein n=1 Tax=Imshaugia aleurites TaxID=172621 RepID=A0A8H3FLM8_9LECA|nr:hypothetical protein IMSHALPRED_007194 [Imshaugia aleurites]